MNNYLVKLPKSVANISTICIRSCSQKITRPLLRQESKLRVHRISPFGWFMLIIPASSFYIGVWQIQRKKWKDDLLQNLKDRIACDPVDLPHSLEQIKELEYKPVRVRGTFLHDKELYMGPRTLVGQGDASTKSSLVTSNTNTSHGYLVVTPFKLADRDEIILVNRGWVPSRKRDPKWRSQGQTDGVVDLLGIVRLNEKRPVFSIKNQQGSNIWFYRDLENMCAQTGASPIFLDATDEFDSPHGPIGGQTRVTLRNEHLSYIWTFFALSGATGYMWYLKFLKNI